MALVLSIALVAMVLLMSAYRTTIRSQATQRVTQVRVDVSQRESAILRSILAIAPNRAIQAMSENSSLASSTLTWNRILADSIALANADNADSDGVGATLGTDRSSNAANFSGNVTDIFQAVSGSGLLNAGVNYQISSSYPPYLTASTSVATLDATYPIVTHEKIHGANTAGFAQLSTTLFPLFNRIPYPNIRFGYGEPGSSFVAKRNYWAFSIRYPTAVTGVRQNRKNYVLSLYEVPTQVALSASAFMSLGRHENGTSWAGVQIDGSVFGERILAEESLSINRMSSRKGIEINAAPTVGGTAVKDNFDSDDTVQAFESQNDSFFPVSVAASAGRVAFVPLNRGLDFYRFVGTTNDPNRLSPTGWNDYSIGARQCAIKVLVTEAVSSADQTPLEITVTFKTGANANDLKTVTLRRNDNWPLENEAGGSLVPFQTETTDTSRRSLTVFPTRFNAWLVANGGAGLDINHSIAINQDPSGEHIRLPSFPSEEEDLAVVMREGSDLTAFTKGFSLVTNVRLYFAGDLNSVPTTAPSGSDVTGTFYPPMSIFSPEKRWGVTAQQRVVKFRGRLGSIDSGSGDMIRPLDLRSGQSDQISTDIDAILSDITSPAQLPPVTFPNWLFTIEEVDTRSAGGI